MSRRNFTAVLLALALMVGMAVPAQAAGIRLQWEQSGSSVELKLRGLGEESVYGVQLEMTVDGVYTAAFTPAAAEAYSPECQVSSSDRRTRVTLYISSQKPLNSGGVLEVGGLTLSGGFTMPQTVNVKLLGHELKPLAGADGIAVPPRAKWWRQAAPAAGATMTAAVSRLPTGSMCPRPATAR